ncbi:MAG: hypothetical protein N4A64_05715 [Marinisporobacter sp.]|nr:hypothetical protein [Marinisporobacter sp.]
MENTEKPLVKTIGIHKNTKENSAYFSFVSMEEVMTLPEHMPDIKNIISIIIEPEIISKKCIDTMRGQSAEGQYLSGKKLVVHMKLKQKILYLADVVEKTIHTFQNECFQSVYIVIPKSMDGSDPKDLLRFDYLKTQVTIQEIVTKKINERCIFKKVSLLVDLVLIPTYQLSYSMRKEQSDIFICYMDGSHKKQITFSRKSHNIKPKWSSTGWEIAFLSDEENKKGKYMLYVYSLVDGRIRRMTDPKDFDAVGGFCWDYEDQRIIFSASYKEQKKLFCINIHTLDWKQLTFGNREGRNYKPKSSPVGGKIAFLQAISGISNLYMIDTNTGNMTKLTSCGFIKDFDWSKEGKHIAYIWDRSGEYNRIYLIDLDGMERIALKTPKQIITMRNIQFSSDNKHIAFIGSDLITDNIFYYDLRKKRMIRLTNNYNGIKISDFIWKADGASIYYVANDLEYYNIYRISIKDSIKYALTSTMASDISLSYRPKIV